MTQVPSLLRHGEMGLFQIHKQTHQTGAKHQQRARFRDGGGLLLAAAAEAVAAEVGAAAAEVFGGVIVGDLIGIHRHRGMERDGSTAQNLCGGIQRDALIREDIACEGGAGAEGRGATDHPIYFVTRTTIDHVNRRAVGEDERAPRLENESRIGIPLSVERERSRQQSCPAVPGKVLPGVRACRALYAVWASV